MALLVRLDVVVAHYSTDAHPEPLDWLVQLHKVRPDARIYVYYKGDVPCIPDGVHVHEICQLPNVGRESHTYLHHILQHYYATDSTDGTDFMAQNTLFTQGAPLEHRPARELYGDFLAGSPSGLYPPTPGAWFAPTWKNVGGSIKESLGTDVGIGIGDWWGRVFEKHEPFPGRLLVIWAAIFNVSRDRILRRPRAFYERAIATVAHDVNPEEGHYFERSWGNVFGA
jgi:hypothetical protein